MGITSKSIRLHQTGGPEVLQLETVDVSSPAAHEVRIRHTAIGVNYAEVYVRIGHYPMPLPTGIGNEAAGVVEEIGKDVQNVKIGDRVCYGGGNPGAYSERRNIDAARLIKIPDGMSDEVAAASILKGMTVEYLLNRCYPLKKDEIGLFYAASGGVGLIAGQWAKYIGAKLIGVASGEEKCKLALANGYAYVIDRSKENVGERVKQITGGKGVPVVFDSVGKATYETSINCLAPRGMFVSFGSTTGPVPPIQAAQLQKLGSLYFTRPTLATYTASRDDLVYSSSTLFKLISSGQIKITINAKYALKDVQQAHADLEAGRTSGSSVLIP